MIYGRSSQQFLLLSRAGRLNLGNNDFTGTVPDSLYELTNLSRLTLSGISELGGSIAEDISQLTGLTGMNITSTGVGGTLPEGLFDLGRLESLELGLSSFSGTLSESFGRLTSLSYVRLFNNTFTGTVPNSFSQPKNLRK